MGGVIGIVMGYGGVKFFGRYQIPTDLPISLSVQLDKRVFLFSLAISLPSAVLCGLAPTFQTTRTNLVTALKTAEADIPGRRRLWGRNTLVICQIAASLALLTAAVQMVRTFQEKWRSGPGFRTHHLFTMAFDPQLVRFTEAQTERFYKDLVRRARMLPGVKSAALTGELPMSNDQDGVSVIPEGYQMPTGKESFPVDMDVAGEGYFSTLGVQLVRGRGFHETDTVTSPKVAVVNEQFAKHYWPNSDARVLALAGLYGVVTYSANRRTREIGIRMAVGADAKAVLRMVPRQAVLLVIGSMGIGLVLAAAAEKGLHAIFARSGTDLGAYVLILPALVAVTMVAAFIPARRVSRIEPTRAWRYE